MRNLREYPVTLEELVAAIRWASDEWTLKNTGPDAPVGSVTGVALQKLLKMYEELLSI